MADTRGGLNPRRMVRLMREAVERCHLDLSGAVVLTEAASGAYVVTPVLAALAGATRVHAVTRDTRYGTAEEIWALTRQVASLAGCESRIEFSREKTEAAITAADIVTNSGHVRPLDGTVVERLKAGAVIGLMYEAWEFRAGDLDLAACRRRGIPVVGVNERHPNIDVFGYLGVMAVKLLLDAGVGVYRTRILLLCDNPFVDYIVAGLRGAGALVDVAERLPARSGSEEAAYDAVVVALKPGENPVLGAGDAQEIASRWPGAVVAQYWGDFDRGPFVEQGIELIPATAPGAGHMGVLPSGPGPEAIVRLQSGGLKAAEVAWRRSEDAAQREYAQFL